MRMPRFLSRSAAMIDDRTGLITATQGAMYHRVPRNAKWWYVFGSATLMFFIIQLVTGVLLTTLYVPSAAEAYASLVYIDEKVPGGWMLRALHGWSSNAMCVMMLIHMMQVFLHGTYKYPRELTWVAGTLLCVTTLALAFTGQVMRWDSNAYWGLGIGAAIVDRAPFVGNWLRAIVLGGPDISGATLSRFFALHVFILPGTAIALIGLHLMLVLKNGISEMPKPGETVKPETYREEYHARIKKTGVPFFPDAARRDMVFCGAMLIVLIGIAAWFGPFGPGPVPDPTIIEVSPKPDTLFLWIFAVLALLPPNTETFLLLAGPPVIIGFLAALPFISPTGERAPSRRPLSVVILVAIVTALGVLTVLGEYEPWSPRMRAWTSDTTPVEYVKHRSPLELQGALQLQYAQCRNCHSIGGIGGKRGPALDAVATRLSWDQLVRQIQQGGGNMPAYGKNLSSAEVQALVAFLSTLDDQAQPALIPGAMEAQPARDESPTVADAAAAP